MVQYLANKCGIIIILTTFGRKYAITDKKTFDRDPNYLGYLISDDTKRDFHSLW